MKSEKGITITSLIIYIGILFVVVMLVGRITSFIYENSNTIKNSYSESDYNKLNLYILKETKNKNTKIASLGYMENEEGEYNYKENSDEDSTFTAIRFYEQSEDDEEIKYTTIGLVNDHIYYTSYSNITDDQTGLSEPKVYSNVKICSDVDTFEVSKKSEDKLEVKVKFKDNTKKEYTNEYTITTKTVN